MIVEELISRIITIEDYAKAITRDAYHSKTNMEKEIKEEIQKYKLSLKQKEQANQEEINQIAKLSSEKEIQQAQEKLKSVIEIIDKKYEVNKSDWEEVIFRSIIH